MIKKIDQTDFTDVSGDCLRACAATVCGLELAEVPHFMTEENWRLAYITFWFTRGKIVNWFHTVSTDMLYATLGKIKYKGLCILAVDSFVHEGKLHAVVGNFKGGNLEVFHDPNPLNRHRAGYEYAVSEIDLFI